MTLSIKYAGLTDLGRVRPENEDTWAVHPELGLFIVADGMGGHLGGGLASKIVVETMPLLVQKRLAPGARLSSATVTRRLKQIVGELSDRLRDGSKEIAGISGMGSTMVAVLIRDQRAFVVHLGDSRAYLLRNGRLQRLTRDHSVVQLLIESGEIKEEDVPTHPARGMLSRFMGMPVEALPEARSIAVRPKDVLLLCSDGLTGMLPDEAIQAMLLEHEEPEALCAALIRAANDAGGKDNITSLVIACPEGDLANGKSPVTESQRDEGLTEEKHNAED